MNKFLLFLILTCLPCASFAQTGNALAFDNIDDYAYVPGSSSLIAGSTAVSMSMWVYPQNSLPVYPDLEGFAGFRNNTDADFYILQLSATSVEARFRNSGGIAYDITFPGLLVNTWQHFVLTLDGSSLTLYHNGTFAGSATVTGSINAFSESFYMGMLPWTGANFHLNGKLDEVCLWNKALGLADIACVMDGGVDPTDPDLQLYYKCNQGTAGGNNAGITSVTDATGNVNAILTGFALSGNVSNFVGGVATPSSTSFTDLICPGGTYTFGSQTLTAPGTYFETFIGTSGCDSVVQLTLTSPTINTSISQTGPILISQQAGATYQWIDCLNGNTAIPGANSQSYTATANGQYAVVVTLGSCSDTSVCATVVNVGINEVPQNLFSAGPNPFTDELIVKTNYSATEMILNVVDPLGRIIEEIKITSASPVKISTSNWPAGIYFITDTNHFFRKRCVKL
jgi:hypothetical protein